MAPAEPLASGVEKVQVQVTCFPLPSLLYSVWGPLLLGYGTEGVSLPRVLPPPLFMPMDS